MGRFLEWLCLAILISLALVAVAEGRWWSAALTLGALVVAFVVTAELSRRRRRP